jgi:ADP-ribose pyrophosphatase
MASAGDEKRPQVAVGGLIINQDRVLLVKRKNPPSQGLWALPGGRVEWGETMVQAVEREVLEETGIVVKAERIVYTFDSITRDEKGEISFHYIIIDFVAHPLDLWAKPVPGDDAEEVRWLTLKELKNLPVSKPTLELVRKVLAL